MEYEARETLRRRGCYPITTLGGFKLRCPPPPLDATTCCPRLRPSPSPEPAWGRTSFRCCCMMLVLALEGRACSEGPLPACPRDSALCAAAEKGAARLLGPTLPVPDVRADAMARVLPPRAVGGSLPDRPPPKASERAVVGGPCSWACGGAAPPCPAVTPPLPGPSTGRAPSSGVPAVGAPKDSMGRPVEGPPVDCSEPLPRAEPAAERGAAMREGAGSNGRCRVPVVLADAVLRGVEEVPVCPRRPLRREELRPFRRETRRDGTLLLTLPKAPSAAPEVAEPEADEAPLRRRDLRPARRITPASDLPPLEREEAEGGSTLPRRLAKRSTQLSTSGCFHMRPPLPLPMLLPVSLRDSPPSAPRLTLVVASVGWTRRGVPAPPPGGLAACPTGVSTTSECVEEMEVSAARPGRGVAELLCSRACVTGS